MHKERDLVSSSVGKVGDMILVNGNPVEHISDIRRVDVVIKGGEVYRPSEMYPAYGIRPD